MLNILNDDEKGRSSASASYEYLRFRTISGGTSAVLLGLSLGLGGSSLGAAVGDVVGRGVLVGAQ